jgi:hypothetical protein
MNDDNPEHHYLQMVQAEKDAFERAKKASETAGPERREALARDWFNAASKLLQMHWRSHAMPDHSGPLEPYPGDAILRLANLAEALASGRLPQPIRDVTAAGGRPERWPGERKDIAIALHYIALAQRGEIKDPRFIVTVCKAFQVDRTTVRDWQAKNEEILRDMRLPAVGEYPDALHKAGARFHFNRKGETTPGVD